jgi:hypothetical protein
MSATVLRSPELTRSTAPEEMRPLAEALRGPAGWNPENFAREQIRGLVRRVFLSNGAQPVRQVVFSALEPETDVCSLCRRVGEALAAETPGSIAVVGGCPRLVQGAETQSEVRVEGESRQQSMPLRQIARRVRGSLWLLPDGARSDHPLAATSLHSFLSEVRRQFEYSILQGPCAAESAQAAAMAQFADGIILVLSAQRTRRAAARKIKETLEAAQAQLLGTVLVDRVFPLPEPIYRRL